MSGHPTTKQLRPALPPRYSPQGCHPAPMLVVPSDSSYAQGHRQLGKVRQGAAGPRGEEVVRGQLILGPPSSSSAFPRTGPRYELAIGSAIGRPASRENVDESEPLPFEQYEGMLVRSLHAAEGTERRPVRRAWWPVPAEEPSRDTPVPPCRGQLRRGEGAVGGALRAAVWLLAQLRRRAGEAVPRLRPL